ncbi:MAG: hypothetical protein LBT26_10985, partial [Clostridiales Family XIII bacterium]|nr:hypothetical protein [Clostridiales Family XIII bacterium]
RQASLAEPVDTASISGTRRLAWRKKSSPLCPMFNCRSNKMPSGVAGDGCAINASIYGMTTEWLLYRLKKIYKYQWGHV